MNGSAVLLEQVPVASDVAGECLADHDGGAEAELVAFLPDLRDGDGLRPDLGVDADVHLRRRWLVRHGINSKRCVETRASTGLQRIYTPATLGPTHLPHLISTEPRNYPVAVTVDATRKEVAMTCTCDPTRGQSCLHCDGTYAEVIYLDDQIRTLLEDAA